MDFDVERVRENAQKARTDDLLDRVTVFRAGLEPEALDVILEELRSRGLSPTDVVEHEREREGVLFDENGTAMECVHCRRPAVARQMEWHRLFDKVPLFPRMALVCADHRRPDDSEPLPPPKPTE